MSLPSHIFLEIATPEKHLLAESIEWAHIPTLKGYIGILPGHSPLVTILGTGELTYRTDREEKSVFVSGGIVEVLPSWVRVLAEVGEKIEEIDVERAKDKKEEAEKIIKNEDGKFSQDDIQKALNSLRKAEERLSLVSKRISW
ncbi:MAG: ATP synthase F1 subunit epsilon [Candidatus Aminicenantia bacterium]